MKTGRQMGIWMDHSNAVLMDATVDTMPTTHIESDFTSHKKKKMLDKGEYTMHRAEQHDQHAFYQKICDVIKNYDHVILFGPTSSKEELANLLKTDKHFEKIQIDVKTADRMSRNQQMAFVKDHFKHPSVVNSQIGQL